MRSGPVACTIVANNYLAYARVFARSFRAHHPEGQVAVLIVDRPDPTLRYAEEPFSVFFVEDLGLPAFRHFAFRYSILELSTAVKPAFLLHLHRQWGLDRACYFDPDILVLAPLDELFALLGDCDAVVTPHVTAPIEDDRVPGERDFLLSGIYNLGFLGLAFNERTLRFADWWHRRLYRDCRHAVEQGLFVDQRWMDFAPAFLERLCVLRDPAYNVAYWNLSERRLTEVAGQPYIGERPVRFVHFSGFVPAERDSLSRFQNRFTLAERPDVAPLFRDYGASLTSAGQAELAVLPYAYGFFADGTPIPGVARRLLQQADPLARRWPDPFAVATGDDYLAWLCAVDDPAASVPLPRALLALWDQRPDLQRLCPQPTTRDRVRLASWCVAHGASVGLAPALLRSVAERLAQLRAATDPPPGAASRLARRFLDGGAPARSALSAAEVAAFNAPALSSLGPSREPLVSYLAMQLHGTRADLQTSYPEPLAADRAAFALWFATHARLEYDLPFDLVRPVLASLAPRPALWARLWWYRQALRRRRHRPATVAASERTPPPPTPAVAAVCGVNVIGWAGAPTGVGEACRGSLTALARAGVPHAVWDLGADAGPLAPADAAGREGGEGLPFEVALLHVNADMTAQVLERLPRALLAGRHRIGYWFWELAHLPLGFAPAFALLDEVWAPSRFCLEAFRPLAAIPVCWVPPAVTPPTAPPTDRRALGLPPDRFLFFAAFDARSVPARKNPEGLLQAFARASAALTRPHHLLLKAQHLDAAPELERRLRELAAGLPVTLETETLPRAAMEGLLATCDAYVSLHRSEGLGLPLIEAMFLAKPVVATGYGGVTDFLDDETGFVVRHRLVALTAPQGPYPEGAVWGEPDLDHAAALMCQVAEQPEAAAARLVAAKRRVTELYAPAAAALRLAGELARLGTTATGPPRRPRGDPADAAPPPNRPVTAETIG